MVLDDVTGGNCLSAGYISTYKVRFLVEHSDEGRGDSDCLPIVFKEANIDE